MHKLGIGSAKARPFRLLCLGAHADDIEIGCGGLLLNLVRSRQIDIKWVVFSAAGERAVEARRSARLFVSGTHRANVRVYAFRDGFFPFVGADIKAVFERLKRSPSPDLVLTHYREDRHQDHRLLSDLTWNTFRDHWILEYEIPKFDGDLGSPNVFVPLDTELRQRKLDYINRSFGSQRDRHWFTDETFLGLMRLRGMECRAPSGYAEAFYSRKGVLQF